MIILWGAVFALIAGEPTIATLTEIENNRYLNFKIEQISYWCQPYGVVTLEELLQNKAFSGKCKAVIDSFYRADPQARYFAHNRLKRYQRYHLQFKKNSCVMYAMGMRRYAELLLEEGLALYRTDEADEVVQYRFSRAQESARVGQKGIWSEMKWSKCAESFYGAKE